MTTSKVEHEKQHLAEAGVKQKGVQEAMLGHCNATHDMALEVVVSLEL